jgi:hypothetical protein
MFIGTGIILALLLLLILLLLLGSSGMNGYRKRIFGTVISINGKTFTLKRKVRFNGDSTTYTIDASNAKVTKNNSNSSTELGIAIGDTVMVKGMISGIIFAAKDIKDRTPYSKVPPPEDTEVF